MPKVLIVYGTTDGHTRTVARILGDTLETEGCHAHVYEAGHAPPVIEPEDYDGVLVLASVHGGRFQRSVGRWVRRHAAALNRLPGAFLAVCLAILEDNPETQRTLRETLERFHRQTGWRPVVSKPVAGALPYTRYNFLKRWIMKRIVSRAGGDTDTGRDYEYTDWEDLRAFARDFAARVHGGALSLRVSG